MLLASPIPKYTSNIIMINAIPGREIASLIMSVRAINTIINIRYPESVNPAGVGNKNRINAIMMVMKSHRFCVNQKIVVFNSLGNCKVSYLTIKIGQLHRFITFSGLLPLKNWIIGFKCEIPITIK